MTKPTTFLIAGLCAAGLVSGIAARRLTHGTSAAAPDSANVETKSAGTAKNPEAVASKETKSTTVSAPVQHSTDTAEILLALDDTTLYPRLAAWLLDAGEADIAAYWNGYKIRKNRKTYIADLVFINWTRLDPAGAIAAVAGTKDDYFPWWAWTCHDPQAALAAALAKDPKKLNMVARGIGGFHPDWLRDHLDQIPEAHRSSAFYAFTEVDDGENPLETLKFIQENSMGFDNGIFKSLVQQDPWAAFEWLKENPSLTSSRYHYSEQDPLGVLLDTMLTEAPDDLKRLVAQTPSGELKRKMEAKLFENLLETDPAAAIAEAKSTDSTIIASERFAKIGLSLLKTDPDEAFEMAKNLFTINPAGTRSMIQVEFPNGSSNWGGSESGNTELITALIAKDPARLMEIAIQPGKDKPEGSQTFMTAANQWANQDLVGYTNWVNQQTDPAIRNPAAGQVISQLAQMGQFTEAIEWVESSGNAEGYINSVLYQWHVKDAQGAANWLDTSNLSEEKKAGIRETLKQISSQIDQ